LKLIGECEAVEAFIFADRVVLYDGAYVTVEIWHKELVPESGHMFESRRRRHDHPKSLAPIET
jgi:hypothetical protein